MAIVNIKGTIVSNNDQWIYDFFDMEATSPKKVNEAISKANGGDLEVYINSPGGEVFAGSEIYTLLKSYSSNVTVNIIGIAASIASVIAMAGKKVMMSPTASFMIHNVSISNVQGDYRAMEHMSGVLKTVTKTIANSYMIKTGLSQEKLLDLMNKETWLTPQEALSFGFVDEIMFEGMSEKEKAQAQINLLKLKTGIGE